jgi:hypothetical protein
VGKTWRIAPSLGGGLTSVEAGFETSLGSFATNVTSVKGGMNISFATPKDNGGRCESGVSCRRCGVDHSDC